MKNRKRESKLKIGVTGADGFLGSRILRFYARKYEIKGYHHTDMDFTDPEETETMLKRDCPDILIHTAAISDVGACEQNPEHSEPGIWRLSVRRLVQDSFFAAQIRSTRETE